MIAEIFLISLGLIWILFATVQDLKTREVANWLNFSLIIFALGFRFFYSLFSENFNFFYQGLIGFGIFFVLGNLFYYGRIFAGGDAKLLIALGAVLPLSENFYTNIKFFGWFLLIFLFVATFYGLVVSGVLAFRNSEKFKKEFSNQFRKNRRLAFIVFAVGIIIMGFGFLEQLFFVSGVLVFLFPYLYFFAKSVDNSCLVKIIDTKKLREGDWLYRDLKIGKELIKSNWEGLSKSDINKIKKKYKEIKIKQGVAFVPVFLISFLIWVFVVWKGL